MSDGIPTGCKPMADELFELLKCRLIDDYLRVGLQYNMTEKLFYGAKSGKLSQDQFNSLMAMHYLNIIEACITKGGLRMPKQPKKLVKKKRKQ